MASNGCDVATLRSEIRNVIHQRKAAWKWEGSAHKAWAAKYVSKNAWRVRWFMDYEDCMQTAAWIFAECVDTYGAKVDNPAWMMSLFQRMLSNEFHTLATKCTQERTAEKDFVEIAKEDQTDVEHETASLSVALKQVSEELGDVLRVIANAPSEFLDVFLMESSDEGWSRRLCRLAKTKKLNDGIVSELRDLVAGHRGEGRNVYSHKSTYLGE